MLFGPLSDVQFLDKLLSMYQMKYRERTMKFIRKSGKLRVLRALYCKGIGRYGLAECSFKFIENDAQNEMSNKSENLISNELSNLFVYIGAARGEHRERSPYPRNGKNCCRKMVLFPNALFLIINFPK